MSRVAVVTGSNKGLGYAMVKLLSQNHPDWIIYLTARDEARGLAAVEQLKNLGLHVRFHLLDITSEASITKLRHYLVGEHGGFDVLINNAGIAFKVASTVPFHEQAEVTAATNYFGTLKTCRTLFPVLRDHARVVIVSSTDGHEKLAKCSPEIQSAFRHCKTIDQVDALLHNFIELTKSNKHLEMGWVNSAYGTAHIALTTASYLLQHLLDEDKSREDRIVNSCCPGGVKTDMSSYTGEKTPEEGADTPLYLATLPENCKKPRGQFVTERKIMPLFS